MGCLFLDFFSFQIVNWSQTDRLTDCFSPSVVVSWSGWELGFYSNSADKSVNAPECSRASLVFCLPYKYTKQASVLTFWLSELLTVSLFGCWPGMWVVATPLKETDDDTTNYYTFFKKKKVYHSFIESKTFFWLWSGLVTLTRIDCYVVWRYQAR